MIKKGKYLDCPICNKNFYVNSSRLRKNNHHTCSKKCSGIHSSKLKSKKVIRECVICGDTISYKKSASDKVKNPTCSRTCARKWKSIHYKGLNNPNSLKLSDEDKFFNSRCESYRLRSKNNGIDCDLDYIFLKELFHKQSGRCYYSNLDMRTVLPKDYNTASLDRVDPNKGYIKNNVVWCLNSINMLKSNYDVEIVNRIAEGLISSSFVNREVQVKKIRENAILPKRVHSADAGYDVYVSKIEDCGDYIKVYSGIAIRPDVNTWFMLTSRSSNYKKGLLLQNGVGIIDQNYSGEIVGIFYKTQLFSEVPKVGDRCMQLIPQQQYYFNVIEVDELSETNRGDSGFGGSGA